MPKRVLIFGTGGGSGVTRVMVDIACAHKKSGAFEPLLVFRRKRKPVGQEYIDKLEQTGVRWAETPASPKWTTVSRLQQLIREFQPIAVVCHGNPEHIWGRMAAVRENVSVVVQVEQNMERYKWLGKWLARRLNQKTDAIVGVSHGVADHLRELKCPPEKVRVIHNGSNLELLEEASKVPFSDREPAALMSGRFASQKDHLSLIRAAGILRDKGTPIKIRLAGGGGSRHRKKAETLIEELDLGDWIEILGRRSDIPDLLARHRVFVLSTHFEGLPLSLSEAMSAGCAVVATDVIGPNEMIEDRENGWLVPRQDPEALATALSDAVKPAAEAIATRGRETALSKFSVENQASEFEKLVDELS